jgi:hypothetical protein
LNIARIVSELKAERKKLDAAIRALECLAPSSNKRIRPGKQGRKTERPAAVSRKVQKATGKVLMFSVRRLAHDKSREMISGKGSPA